MKKLKAFFGNQTTLSARVLAAALLIGTACSWYAILKPELKIKSDDSESLRRRIEAAVAPGREYLSSPVLVRTANKRYLVTIQETKRANNAYKAELADYLKSIAKSETRAQLDVVYAKSPTLLVKSAVSALFNSSSAPVFLGILFLALVRLFYAPILALATAAAPALEAFKQRQAERRAIRASLRQEELERKEAQRILDLELADLQAEADKAFAAQAATAESQRLAYEAAMAEEAANQIVPGTITEIEITAEEVRTAFTTELAPETAALVAAEVSAVSNSSTSFEFADDTEDFVEVTTVADFLAKVPAKGVAAVAFEAAPLAQDHERSSSTPEASGEEPAFVASSAGGLTFIEEAPAAETTSSSKAESVLATALQTVRSVFAPALAAYTRFTEQQERARDRKRVARANAEFVKAKTVLNEDLRNEVDRLTSQLNGAKLSWLETATHLQEMKMKAQQSKIETPKGASTAVTEVSLDLAKLDFIESSTPADKDSTSGRNADLL